MAKIIKKSDHLTKQYLSAKKRAMISAGFAGGFFFLFALCMITSFLFLCPVFMVGFGVSSFVAAYFLRQLNSLRSGIMGEAATADIVRNLPDDYIGFQNLTVAYNGEQSELDMVVIGPTGVFVIETKNLNGSIVGNYADKHWKQEKIGRNGTPYSSRFYSPVAQVGTHVYRLANKIRDNGISVYVNSAVYFSNDETEVFISGEQGKIPVFAANRQGDAALRNFILAGNKTIDDGRISKIVQLLNK